VLLYQPDRFAKANPPKIHPPATIVPLILRRRPQVFPWFAPVIAPFSLQPISPILIISETTTLNTSCTQDLDLVISDQIIECL